MSTVPSVKVSYGEDLRRFALENNSFLALEETIRRTYNFQGGRLIVKYQDDEKDWVTISSDPELAVAIQLASSNSLRLSVNIEDQVKSVEAGLTSLYPTIPNVVSPSVNPMIPTSPIEAGPQHFHKEHFQKEQFPHEHPHGQFSHEHFHEHFHKHHGHHGHHHPHGQFPHGQFPHEQFPKECKDRKCEKHQKKQEKKLEQIQKKALKYGIARFVADVTIPDGTVILPGTEFVKVWRIRNESVTIWPQDYLFVHKKGDRLTSLECVRLPKDVAPGEEFDISVAMKAPSTVGRYFSVWRLTGPKEKPFGQPFHVKINVYDPQGPIFPPKEEPWEMQVTELAAMGFTDRFEVERLLKKCHGDMDKVVWKLLKLQHKMKYKGEKCIHKMEKHLMKAECKHGPH